MNQIRITTKLADGGEPAPYGLAGMEPAAASFAEDYGLVGEAFRGDGCPAAAAEALPALPRAATLRAKRVIDVVGATLLLALLWPLMLVLGLAVRLADGGPALIAHKRVGRFGAPFGCLKFRSMVVDADQVLARVLAEDPAAREEWAERRKLRSDPRITRIGRFLRASSLDELPQLLNVLRGEMSLVGPRPVVRAELEEHYDREGAAHYLAVRPGLTGCWQVSGRSDMPYRERVTLDIDYVVRLSLLRDAAILVRTLAVVLAGRGGY